jgi:hypothetical protein
MSEQYSQQYAGAAKAATEGELKVRQTTCVTRTSVSSRGQISCALRHVSSRSQGAAASAQAGDLKGAAARSKAGERMGGAVPIGEKNMQASDPDYVPKEGEQATQEELAGADYESGTCMRFKLPYRVLRSFRLQVLQRARLRVPRRAPSSDRCARFALYVFLVQLCMCVGFLTPKSRRRSQATTSEAALTWRERAEWAHVLSEGTVGLA